MKKLDFSRWAMVLPMVASIAAVATLAWWWHTSTVTLPPRLPGEDQTPDTAASSVNPVLSGQVLAGHAKPEDLPGSWPQFRGVNRDGIESRGAPLARTWKTSGPRELWAVDCGEGYAGAAVRNGRVYLMDYDYDKKQNALRCLSLSDGAEIWRYAYTMPVKRNHGMTRTVPAVSEKFIVAMDPKCNVLCLDALSGELKWGMSLTREFGTTIPPWYAGQCPLIDSNAAILAPAGKDCLLAAIDLETGRPVWKSPNPREWKMTHSSIMPMTVEGEKFYVYCGSGGVAGVSARDGSILWQTDAWKISIATVPSPVPLDGGRILLAGGYDAGCLLLQLKRIGNHIEPEVVWRLGPEVFGATQHTPIFHDGHFFGTRPDGRFVCLGLDGNVAWTSPPGNSFGLGSFLLADGMFFVMNDSGKLTLIEDSNTECKILGQSQVLKGRESWGPMAMAGNRLIVRDFTRMACLDLGSDAAGR